MKLLTETLKKKIPPLYAQDGKGDNATVYAKFFCPWNNWTWYVTELESVKHPQLLLGIEREIHFEPIKLRDIEGVK